MAPLVISQDSDLTDSEEEKKEIKTSKESVENNNEELNISTSPADASEHVASKVSDTSIEVDCKTDENSVAETSAVDATPVTYRTLKLRTIFSDFSCDLDATILSDGVIRVLLR